MCMSLCKKCTGISKIVFGVLLLLNAYVWPRWYGIDGWITWIAILMGIFGFLMVVVPNKCPSCQAMAVKKGKKK